MKDFNYLIGKVEAVLDTVVPFIIGLAVLFVIWGIFNYVIRAADEEKRAEAKKYIFYGVVGVFLMLSIWGFVNILYNTLDLDRNIAPGQIPQIPRIEGGSAGGRTWDSGSRSWDSGTSNWEGCPDEDRDGECDS